MASQPIKVFASYSHDDASLVGPVVALLRASRALVFLDRDRIPPGTKWRDEIHRALGDAHQVVVFWCEHSRSSPEVADEWQKAIALSKEVLPLLLDETPLPPGLADYQWIDFRRVVGPRLGHSNRASLSVPVSEVPPQPMRVQPSAAASPPRRSNSKIVGTLAATLVVVALGLGWWIGSAPHGSSTTPVPAPASSPLFLAWMVAILIGALATWWISRRKRTSARALPKVSLENESIEGLIARQIEAELLRRGGGVASPK